MNKRSIGFRITDALLVVLTILPLIAGLVIKAVTTPASDGIEISGARIFFTIKMPLQDLPITESQVNTWLVIIAVFFLCLFLTHGLDEKCSSKRQAILEWIVEKTDGLVNENMGDYFKAYAPFVAAIMALSVFSSLLTLVGLFPPTSDLNVIAGWAVLVFFMITYYKLKGGFVNYLKGFTEPFVPFTPFNIISEFATPISMSFRHYGNVLSGSVISALVAAGLQGASKALFGWLPGQIGSFPFLQIGLPAVLSLYFDIFSGCLQAFIFAMLTMLYVSGGFPMDEWEKRMARKKDKKLKKQNKLSA